MIRGDQNALERSGLIGNQVEDVAVYELIRQLFDFHGVRIPMMSISHSDLMPIRTERSDAGLSQCGIVIDIRQECFWFLLS